MCSSMNATRMIEPNTQSCRRLHQRSCEAECHRSIARPWLPDRLAGLGAQPKEVVVQTVEFGDTIGERHGSLRAAQSVALTLTVVRQRASGRGWSLCTCYMYSYVQLNYHFSISTTLCSFKLFLLIDQRNWVRLHVGRFATLGVFVLFLPLQRIRVARQLLL